MPQTKTSAIVPTEDLVLDLIQSMAEKWGHPLLVESLEWQVDFAFDADDRVLRDVRERLGPRPRRAALLAVVGDLFDAYRITAGPAGLTATDSGRSENWTGADESEWRVDNLTRPDGDGNGRSLP